MDTRPVVLTCCEYIGKELGGESDSQRGNSIAWWTHFVGLFSMFVFGFTLKAIGTIHIFCLMVSAVDVHRRRV